MERAKKRPIGVKAAIYGGIVVLIIIAAIVRAVRDRFPEYTTIRVAGTPLVVEIVRTPEERAQGLSGRGRLPRDGMLFIFDRPGRYGFWMKDMRFPIDIIWIRAGAVVDIAPNIRPQTSDIGLPTYHPRTDADAVLEVASGWSERVGLRIGSPIRYTGR